MRATDVDGWVHFYAYDKKSMCLWNAPDRYLERLKKFRGVVKPDFSLYRDMPLVMQQWNTYRNRALGYWMERSGIPVIPNVRFADERSYAFCFEGLEQGGVVAVGTHGCIKRREDRAYFACGLRELMSRLMPTTIVVYGAAPDKLFAPCREMGAAILPFESTFAQTHAGRKKVSG